MSTSDTPRPAILVVDDDDFMCDLLCAYLEPEDFDVYTARDGSEAWRLLESGEPRIDVLVTDRKMPELDGMRLLARVRACEKLKSLPVIFQTSLTALDEIVEGINAGVYYYLTKPYNQRLLVAVVKAALTDARRFRATATQVVLSEGSLRMLTACEFSLRTLDEVEEVARTAAQLSVHPQRAISGLTELLLNAVEHGNLEISYAEKSELVLGGRWREEVERRLALPQYRDRIVHLEVTRDEASTTFLISDAGRGFDHASYLEFDPKRATDAHGRGIAMSRLLSFSDLQYIGSGNRVRAKISAPRETDEAV